MVRIFFTCLLYTFIIACTPPPGGDTTIHNYFITNEGKATILKYYNNQPDAHIDFMWAENNSMDSPVYVTNIKVKNIKNFTQDAFSIKVGDVILLLASKYYTQRGTTAPVLIKTYWQFIE